MATTIVAAVFVFGVLVFIHELGHFVTAKLTGMRVDEFALGFGPRIVSFRRGETVYSIRCVPLGGFNDIAGMNREDNDAGPRGYCERPILYRMIVILAGSAMNLILPIFLFFAIFLAAGYATPSTEPVVGSVMQNMPAEQAGFQAGDRILTIDGKEVSTWTDVTSDLKGAGNRAVTVEIDRSGESLTKTLTPVYNEKEKRTLIGITGSVITAQPGVVESFVLAVKETGHVIYMMLDSLAGLIYQMSGEDLAGPIGVVQMTGQVAENGMIPLLRFMAFLSLNLGIINLLPIPVLDGGHFAALCLEALRGKPLGPKAMEYVQGAGLTLLVLIMLFATKNDIMRIFFGG